MIKYEVEWHLPLNPEQTDSMFYCWGDGETNVGTLRAGNRLFHIVANGEMRLNLPNGDVIRYTDTLLSAGLDTNDKLREFLDQHPEALVNNNWFEWYEHDNDGESWEVQDTPEECIASILDLMNGEN